jgi:FAD-dependent urate hydroxylase
MNKVPVAIIGAGPYGLSLAAHLAARKVDHRIFGHPMLFWSQIANAGADRYLKSYCFGTNISTPARGFSFADYSVPRGLETFEPCSIGDFADYGLWFQQKIVPWVEPVDIQNVSRNGNGFAVTLANGESFVAANVVIATGLSYFAYVPPILASLASALAAHTSVVPEFKSFRGKSVAVVGSGQSALEAAALLHEAGARPKLLVRDDRIRWMRRVSRKRDLWRRLRSPISDLGAGPKAWLLTHFAGAPHRMPSHWRTRFVKRHLPPEGAWWLRERVEGRVPVHLTTAILEARQTGGAVELRLGVKNGGERRIKVDYVIAGTGYEIDVSRLSILDPKLRDAIETQALAPKLNAKFEASVAGLRFIGPASAMSFGPLFRFVVGAEYTAQTVSAHLDQASTGV